MKKKYIIIGIFVILLLIVFGVIIFVAHDKPKKELNIENKLPELPKPEVTGGERGKLGIDKNINELTIDNYLGRSDSVYRDMRMLEDPGNYESIGGDSKLSGYIKGFEVVSLPYLIPVTGLPEEVGNTYTGKTLFSIDNEGKYVSNYEESLSIIEKLFPKDKYIFLMCGGGGYAGMTKKLLVSLGWDEDKIYNIGGYWYYDGKNNVSVEKKVNGQTVYDFKKVPYHNIDFDKLTIKKTEPNMKKVAINLSDEYYGKEIDLVFDSQLDLNKTRGFNIDIDSEKKKAEKMFDDFVNKKAQIINSLMEDGKSFIVKVQATDGPCQTIAGGPDFFYILNSVNKVLSEKKVYGYTINLPIFKKTKLYNTVKYAPTVIIVYNGEVYSYVDANKDEIENDSQLNQWINTYVNLDKKAT